jgi:hypothetical protein
MFWQSAHRWRLGDWRGCSHKPQRVDAVDGVDILMEKCVAGGVVGWHLNVVGAK